MELKNMNGFCELSENTMMEIDGGARRVPKESVSGGSWKPVVGAQATVTGWVLSAAGVGTAVGGPVGTLVGACVGFFVATVGLACL